MMGDKQEEKGVKRKPERTRYVRKEVESRKN
jgi:hypothetical protein